MSWISMGTLTAQLPEPSGLRGAASQLRDAAGLLSAQASVTRGVLDAVGPAVWTDLSSDRVRGLLSELAAELSSGYAALSQAADALDSLAGYVSGQQDRYEEAGRELEVMLRDPVSDLSHGKLTEAEQLISERETIEWSVRAAMGQTGDTVMAAVGLADRYHGGGQSLWSRAEQYVGWTAEELASFGSGVWDGSVQVVKGIVGIAVTAAKLSPARLLVDPVGYFHDEEHAIKTIVSTVRAIVADPGQFAEDVLNLQELKKDPEHWLGELIPTVALTFAGLGAGAAGKAADIGETVDAAADAASAEDAVGDGSMAARQAQAAPTVGKWAVGGKLAVDLKDMSEADRLAYLRQVLDLTKSDVPTIVTRTVAGQKVTFPPDSNWSFTVERLDHGTLGEPTLNGAGEQIYSSRGFPKYSGGHNFPGFGVEDPQIAEKFEDAGIDTDFPFANPKPAFPGDWYPVKYVQNTYKLLNDDTLDWQPNPNGRAGYLVRGTVDGTEMEVIVNPAGRGVITSYAYDPTWAP